MAARTDIHRPSAEEFDPEGYEFEDAFDLRPEWPYGMGENQRRIMTVNQLIDEGYRFTGVNGMGQCDHCGAAIRYAALMTHSATKGMIWIGEQCLSNRFSLNKTQFHTLRKNASLNRDRMRADEKLAKTLNAMSEELRAAYEWATFKPTAEGMELCGTGPAAYYVGKAWEDCNASERAARRDKGWAIAFDIASKIRKYGPLTDRQAAFLLKLHAEWQEKNRRNEERAAKVASGEIPSCPEGRIEITGVIVSVKYVENDFGGTYKMLVLDDRGFKVFGTAPNTIDANKGNRVSFSGKVERSQDDPTFGFYSRPTKAKNL